MSPSPEFSLLAASLLELLPPSLPISDTLLLQLHTAFGPMLMSSLQLVDKRQVVRVALPSDRHVYQVASSTGKNYTIHLDLASNASSLTHETPIIHYPRESAVDPAPAEPESPFLDRTPLRARSPASDAEEPSVPAKRRRVFSADDLARGKRLTRLAREMERMYCPCAGWAYGSLAGDKTVLCKHLLAIIIAHKTGQEVQAEVGLHGVVALLGFAG